MRTIFTEAELRAHCTAAGRTCKTETGCRCAAGQLVGIGSDNWVQGPTDWGALDNLDNEPEQPMSPPVWLAMLILVAAGFTLGVLVEWLVGLMPGVRS